jgi:ABC-type transport system involved in multi-copper enzyme maturation permease subunit
MSGKPETTFLSTTLAVAALEWKRLLKSHRATLSFVAATLVTVTVVWVLSKAPEGTVEESLRKSLDVAFLHFLDLLLAFLCCAQSLAEEVESRTVGYLLVRPAPRGAIVLGKLTAGYGLVLAVLTACFIAIGIAVIVQGGGTAALPGVGKAYGALALHTMTVCTICFTCGAIMPEAAGVLAILYIGFVEFLLSFAPFMFRLASPTHLASVIVGLSPDPRMNVPTVSVPVAALGLVLATLTALVLAMLVVSKREYRYASS